MEKCLYRTSEMSNGHRNGSGSLQAVAITVNVHIVACPLLKYLAVMWRNYMGKTSRWVNLCCESMGFKAFARLMNDLDSLI